MSNITLPAFHSTQLPKNPKLGSIALEKTTTDPKLIIGDGEKWIDICKPDDIRKIKIYINEMLSSKSSAISQIENLKKEVESIKSTSLNSSTIPAIDPELFESIIEKTRTESLSSSNLITNEIHLIKEELRLLNEIIEDKDYENSTLQNKTQGLEKEVLELKQRISDFETNLMNLTNLTNSTKSNSEFVLKSEVEKTIEKVLSEKFTNVIPPSAKLLSEFSVIRCNLTQQQHETFLLRENLDDFNDFYYQVTENIYNQSEFLCFRGNDPKFLKLSDESCLRVERDGLYFFKPTFDCKINLIINGVQSNPSGLIFLKAKDIICFQVENTTKTNKSSALFVKKL